jgi:hypothetical protein
MPVAELLRVCFLMVLLVPVVAPPALGAETKAADRRQAENRESDRERAIRKYRQQLAKEPGNASLRLELARNLAWSGSYAEARRECRRVQADSRDRETVFQARKLEAQALSWGGNQKRAAAIYEELLRERPSDVDLQVGLANTLSWSGWSRRAEEKYRAILRSSQSPDAVLGLAEVARLDERWDEAEKHYHQVLKLRPRDPWAIRGLNELRRSTMVTLGVGAGFYRDSTEFERDRYAAEVSLLKRRRISLRTGIVRSRYEQEDGERIYRTALPLQGILKVGPMFSLSAGLSRNDYSEAPDTTNFFIRGHLAPGGDRVRIRLGFDHYDLIDGADPLQEYRYNQVKSIEVARQEIDVDEVRAGIFLRFTGRLTLDADVARGEYSDDNLRYTSYRRLSYRLPTKPRLDLFASLYYQNVEDPSPLYWDPSNFQSYAVGARWEDAWEGIFQFALEGQLAFHPNEDDLLGGQLQGYAEWDLGDYLSVRGSAMYLTSPEDRSGTGDDYDAYYVSGLLVSRFPYHGSGPERSGKP